MKIDLKQFESYWKYLFMDSKKKLHIEKSNDFKKCTFITNRYDSISDKT